MTATQPNLQLDTWMQATWSDYLAWVEDSVFAKAKGYYFHGHLRLEMQPVGFEHSRDHSLLALAMGLFCMLDGIALSLSDNCSFRQTGQRECQPDLACYAGSNATVIPKQTGIVDLDRYPAPDLVVEVAKSSILDDLGIKRSLYEALGVREYWVVDGEQAQVTAYRMHHDGSQRIDASQFLPGLNMAVLVEALQRSRQTNHSTVGNWLMQQFQSRPYPDTARPSS